MYRDESALLDFDTPVVFADGTEFWTRIAQQYRQHTKGYYILGPSGVGKSHFIRQQTSSDWIDGDIIWDGTKAAPKGEWWLRIGAELDIIDARSDVMTEQARRLGFRLIGSAKLWIVPDAVVLPEWETHKKYIIQRETDGYDGGAKSDAFDQVLRHRQWIAENTKGVPTFPSVQTAVEYLEQLT